MCGLVVGAGVLCRDKFLESGFFLFRYTLKLWAVVLHFGSAGDG